jgi:acyl phosphate:glycerol-3-phosphate acyltransferase
MEFLTNINVMMYLFAYLVGAIPFGLLLAKQFAGVNIKESGSKSIGATNVLRVVKEKDPKLAKKLGALTLGLDAAKGILVLVIAMIAGFDETVLWAMAVFAVVGHCYSPYLGFEGGKGVATGMGVVLVLLPIEAIIGLAFWALIAKTVKISAISSMSGLIAALVASYFIHPGLGSLNSQIPLIVIAFIIFYKHIPNFVRLIQGEEKKIV